MGCIQSKYCCCCCGGEEPARTLSSTTFDPESFESVCKASLKRFNVNHSTLGNIEELKLELSNNPELGSFITDYLNTSIETLNFFRFIEECLEKVHSTADLVDRAVYLLETGAPTSSVLKDLEAVKAQDNPFNQTFIDDFTRLCEVHRSSFQKLSEREEDLDQKLGEVEYWKKVGYSVCCVAYVALLVSSVVLVIIAAPPVAITVLGLAGGAITLVLERGINFFLDKLKNSPEGERTAIATLKRQTSKAIHELNNINALVKQLEVYINPVDDQTFGILEGRNDEEKEKVMKMKIAMHGIKTGAVRLKTIAEDLKTEVNRRREDLTTAVATILKALKKNKYEPVACC